MEYEQALDYSPHHRARAEQVVPESFGNALAAREDAYREMRRLPDGLAKEKAYVRYAAASEQVDILRGIAKRFDLLKLTDRMECRAIANRLSRR